MSHELLKQQRFLVAGLDRPASSVLQAGRLGPPRAALTETGKEPKIMKARKRMALLLATAVLGGGVAAAGPAAATAQTHGDAPAHLSSTVSASATKCAGWKSVRLDGNPAGMRYLECWRTYQGKKQSSGAIYLWDNKHDGLEACGKITIGRWFKDWCWSNESQHSPEYISGWHDGSDAKFGLFLAG